MSAKTKAPTKTKPDDYHKIVTTKEVRMNLLFKGTHYIFTDQSDQYNEHHFATVDFVISDSKSHYLFSNSSTKECYENEEGRICLEILFVQFLVCHQIFILPDKELLKYQNVRGQKFELISILSNATFLGEINNET